MRSYWKLLLIYGVLLAAATFALSWLEYKYWLRSFPTEIYVAVIALAFCVLGVWTGHRLTKRKSHEQFTRNDEAFKSLAITPRETEVLELIAKGQSNKEIARTLNVSPNTIKTHVTNLFEKLAVDRRAYAIEKAKSLELIPR